MKSKLLKFYLSFPVIFLIFSQPTMSADSDGIQTAVQFLKTACVTTGSSLEVKTMVGGSLKLRRLLDTGVEASVTLKKREFEGFPGAASKLSAQQASEMRKCMEPYIQKIIDAMLSGDQTGNRIECRNFFTKNTMYKTVHQGPKLKVEGGLFIHNFEKCDKGTCFKKADMTFTGHGGSKASGYWSGMRFKLTRESPEQTWDGLCSKDSIKGRWYYSPTSSDHGEFSIIR